MKGYVEVCLSGVNKERFFNLCRNRKLYIWNIRYDKNNNCKFFITLDGISDLKEITRKSGCHVKFTERHGIIFYIKKYRNRFVFIIGIVLFVLISCYMTSFVWNISLDGNCKYTEDKMIKMLANNGISTGMKCKNIIGKDIEQLIRNTYNDVTWVSVELKGTCLIIHIKENEDYTIAKESNVPCDIVSSKSAEIVSIITRSGTPIVKAGDKVKKNDILISGVLEIKNDSDEVVERQLTTSDGDIIGKVTYNYKDEFPLDYTYKKYTGNEKKAFSFTLSKYHFNIVGLPVKYKHFDVYSEDNQLCIFSNYYLPIYLDKYMYKEYVEKPKRYSEDEAVKIENDKIELFLSDLQEKGVQIIQNNVKIEVYEDICKASGKIIAHESLIKEQPITDADIILDESQNE